MGDKAGVVESRRFGDYLKRVRESRRLSLDAVEEMTLGFSDRVTKSHLSRIENGRATPTFAKMFALSQVYGVPIASMAEQFEVDLRQAQRPAGWAERPTDDLIDEAYRRLREGGEGEALALLEEALGRPDLQQDPARHASVGLDRVGTLIQLGRFALAKELCEQLLGSPGLSPANSVKTLIHFAASCHRLEKYPIAMLAIERAERELATVGDNVRLAATVAGLKGNLLVATDRPEEATDSYAAAIRGYDQSGDPFESCRMRGNLASALIDLGHYGQARRHLTEMIRIAEANRYERLLAYGLSHSGVIAYRAEELDAAEGFLLRSNAIARRRHYPWLVFRNSFYLWRIATLSKKTARARTFERTLRTYLPRVGPSVAEVREYRRYLDGGGDA